MGDAPGRKAGVEEYTVRRAPGSGDGAGATGPAGYPLAAASSATPSTSRSTSSSVV